MNALDFLNFLAGLSIFFVVTVAITDWVSARVSRETARRLLALAITVAFAFAWAHFAQRSGIDGCDHGDTVCSDIARRVQ